MKKKFLALVMTLSMVLSLVPMTALATGDDASAETQGEQQQVEENGTQGESKEQQTQNAGEVNTSSNVSAENVHVTMNNIFMGTNNTSCTIEYKVEPAEYAEQITQKGIPFCFFAILILQRYVCQSTSLLWRCLM